MGLEAPQGVFLHEGAQLPTHVADLTTIMIFLVVGTLFVLVLYSMVRMLAPSSESITKLEPYECGETVVGQTWVHINIRYYIFAMLFLIFDIETVFLFPWAVIFKKLGLFGLIEMVIFILILLVGLAYPWKKGVLRWDVEM
ncbi:MAG TPA: NADH-quinone oxidoreductase subunit A [Actinobacteria bacterium]|nr:NADH-quinone oxidoreductase subunit A [Actinomycetota bacterium]